mgnify:CR=1 FL=1
MAEKFKLTENFTPNTEKRAIFRPTENFQFSDEIKKKWATADAESRAKKALSGIAENVSTELKSGIANSKAIAKSKQFNAYVSGNPIPHINPTNGAVSEEKQPNLLEKIYLDSAKKKQTVGGELNVPEIATMAKFETEGVKEPQNISQAINFKRELDYKYLAEFEKAVQQADDFNSVLAGEKSNTVDKKGFFEKFTDDYNVDKKTDNSSKGDSAVLNKEGIFNYLSLDESRIYRYLIAKGEGKRAREYIKAKTPDLETRKAADVASERKGVVGLVKNAFDSYATGIQGGLTNMARMGVAGNIAAGKNMGILNDLLQPNYSEKLFSAIREQSGNKNKVYGLLLDVANNIGAQVPQVILGTFGGSGVYLAAMAQQIIGGDTTEAINEGYDGMRGIIYGAFDTALEFGTEKLLGGIASKIDGGETSKLVKAALSAVDKSVSNKTVANALAKTIVVLSAANGEGAEEFLQALAEPIMRNVIYGESNKYGADTFEEAVRAYIIGAISGGLMSVSYAGNNLVNTRLDIAGEFIKENSGVGSVLSLSEVTGNTSELYTQIKSEYEAGRDVSNTELAALYLQSEKLFLNPSEDTVKNFAEKNIDALIAEAKRAGTTGGITENAENSVLQSTAKAEDHSEVFHEPDIKDISETPDLYDAVNEKLGGKPARSTAQLHIERVANNIGLNVSWDNSLSRGKYIPSERRIVINPNLKTSEMYNFVLKHEFTHYLESKKGYDGFKDYAFKKSGFFEKWARERLEKSGFDSKGSREEIIKRLTQAEFEAYKTSNELSKIMRDRFTMQNAEAEVLADFVGENLLGTGDRLDMTIAELERIKARNPGIIQRIRDFIRDMINRFKGNKKFGSLVNDLEYLNSRLEKVMRSKDKKTSDNQTEKYSINNVEFSQSDFDKNIETISNMQSVANLTGNEFAKGEKNLVTQVNEFFEKYGNSVENSILGDVDITSRGVKDSMAHGLGRNKAIAFAAVPDVIRDGKIIDYQKNWKGRGYDTVILAAPISISGKAYYEGVIVTRNANTQRFYVHEVITEERTEMPFKTGNANLSAKPGGNSSPSVISLLDKIRNVKENSNKKRVSNWEMRTGLQLPVGSSLTNSNNSISNNDTSVNTNISENPQNDTEEHSIAALPADELLDLYDKGEISRDEYLVATDTHSKHLAMQYIKKWDKETGNILQNKNKLEEERAKAVEAEREAQAEKKDRQSNINNIRRTVRKIDHALRANAHSKHIPEAYRKAATEFCKIFVDNDQATFTHKELADIRAYYNELKGKAENADAPQYDPMVDEWLQALLETVDGKKLTELDTDELFIVKNLTDAFNYQLDHEAEVFLENKKVTYTEIGNAAVEDLSKIKTVFFGKAWNNKDLEKWRGFLYEGNMTPAYFMKRMGPTFEKIYNMLVEGQGRWARNMQTSKEFVTGRMEAYEYDKWKNKTVEFRTESGRTLTLSVNQAMQLVATAQREQSNNGQTSKHLCLGGVVIDTEVMKNALKENGKKNAEVDKILDSLRSRAVQITFEDVKVVESLLTEQQKAYMKDMVDYLSTQCAAWGNEVTMKLYGYRQFLETNYFPYVSSDVFLAKDPARADNTILKSASFTKSLQKNASNPLMLSSFTDVALQHIESMCNYNAVTVPLDTLNKMFNYQVKGADGQAITSVKSEITNKFGNEAVKYMQNFITDLNTGIRGDQRDSVLNSLSSKFKKSAVLANISVVLQQPSAIFRGLRDIDGKYYLKASKYYSKNNYEECKQYAGVAVIKEMGRFDTGMGVKNTSWLSNESTFREKLDDKLGAAAGKADEVAWSFLWSAVKAEIADTTDLKVGSDEFLTKAGERFTQLVNETQVYDSVLVKSQNMRSKSLLGAITSFAAEPTLAVNMLVNSYVDFKEGKKGSGKRLARTVMSLLVTNIVNSALKSLVTAARDDDEDKSYIEKYLGDLVSNSLSELSLFAKIPYLRDLKSLYDGYDIERQDTAVFADLIEAIKATGSESKTPMEKIRKLAEAAANIFGVPLKNVLRDAEAIARTLWNFAFDDITDENGKKKPVFHFGEETTADGIKVSMLEGISENNILKPWHIDGFDYSKSGEYNRMAKALERGDEKTYQKSYNRLTKDGAEDSDIRTGVLKQFKDDKSVKKQADGYLKELKKSGTYKSLSADDKEKLGKDITTALAKEKMVNAQEHKPTEYERLYKLFCTDKAGYKALRAEMLKSGKTEKQIKDGFEIAQYAYLQSIGIDLHEYLLYKLSASAKYADTDGSGGVSKTEKKEALNNMDIDEKTRRQIRQYLLENNY